MKARENMLAKHGSALAALLAAGVALPSLRLPFLADDWIDLASVTRGPTQRTPFGYVRPLCMGSYWIEQELWGLSPVLSHATNLILIAMAAMFVVLLVRRYSGSDDVAGLTGLLFALHPYHIENSAWVAARADTLYSVAFLGAALAYDRWRTAPVGVPVAALILSETALACKETAVVLPLFLTVLGMCDRNRRPTREEWYRGYLPIWILTALHFLIWRPLALGSFGLTVLGGFWRCSVRNLMAYGVAAMLPAQTEFLEERPFLWGLLAILIASTLVLLVRLNSRRLPRLAWVAVGMFVVLLGPSLISFQERYIFLPSVASALALIAPSRTEVLNIAAVLFSWI